MNASNRDFSDRITQVVAPILLGICRNPGDCDIYEHIGVAALKIDVEPTVSDYDIICGAKGRTVRAFKFIVEKAGLMAHIDAELELKDTMKGRHERAPRYNYRQIFPIYDAIDIIQNLWDLISAEPVLVTHEVDISIPGKEQLIVRMKPRENTLETQFLITAIGDVMYPFGYHQGLKINVKVVNADNRMGKSPVLGRK